MLVSRSSAAPLTDLYWPWRGEMFKGYKITDIFSRKIVGWRVEDREADHLAVDMFAAAIAAHGPPRVVHADSGAAMRSNLLRDYLHHQGSELSHNRPYVSNDNPFSEAGFRTIKYRPGYPKVFADLDAARAYIAEYQPTPRTPAPATTVGINLPEQQTHKNGPHDSTPLDIARSVQF